MEKVLIFLIGEALLLYILTVIIPFVVMIADYMQEIK